MTHSPIRLFINGARGRMGARIHALALEDSRFQVIAALDAGDQKQADALAAGSYDVLVDFSSDVGAMHAAQLARTHQAALVVGTTGLTAKTLDVIEETSRKVPVLVAANMSLGVAVLNHIVVETARLLGSDFHVDMIEAHHAAKRDAPSGTALRLAERLRDDASVNLSTDRIHCIRAGDIVGEHSVQFAGPGEKIKISHEATNRDLFVRGALRAAAWLVTQPPGRYSIEHSLALK